MDFQKVFNELKDGIVDLAKNAISTFRSEAEADLRAFLDDSRADIERLARHLANGDLTPEEFEFLIGAKAANARMLALSSKGIARSRIKHLQNAVRDLIIKTVTVAV